MRRSASHWLAIAGLAALAAMLLSPPDAARLLGVAPLAGLIAAGLLAPPKWLMVTAILMLPYFSFGVMQVITEPQRRSQAVIFAALTVAVFLLSMDGLRRGRPRP